MILCGSCNTRNSSLSSFQATELQGITTAVTFPFHMLQNKLNNKNLKSNSTDIPVPQIIIIYSFVGCEYEQLLGLVQER
jgi:hypothetical protein